ncbi:DUF1453 domain-containing protein [Pseudoxanthomonas mexicana]|uniref:DUF1453 domain-containing protein n=1 Tax=Pseudoxanthomonas mexicana TaxID=128785 RepID=UPI00398B3B68
MPLLLLLLPLFVLALLCLWIVLLPLSLWQRYRIGRMRVRLRPWWVRLNGWLLLASAMVFVAVSALSSLWLPGSLAWAAGGLVGGVLLSLAGLALTRFEWRPDGMHYTPSAWIALGLTALIAARIAMGFVHLFRYWREGGGWQQALDHHSLLAVGGIVLGYYLGYAWGLRRRMNRLNDDGLARARRR